jgi:hypothetical protein
MWNNRVTLTVMVCAFLLVAACGALGAAYAPIYADRRTARISQSAADRQAATASATAAVAATQLARRPTETARAGATLTEAARPTITPTPTRTATPTQTASPTPTPTATSPAAIVACQATAIGAERLLYPVPGGGQVRDAVELPPLGAVSVIGRLEDSGWLHVQAGDGTLGWMSSDALDVEPANCQANIYDLSYLLGLTEGREVVADDTLISNENGWTNSAGDPVSPVLGAGGDAQLVLTANNEVDTLRPSAPALSEVPAFELVTSFSRVNFVTGSYVGVRFRSNGLTFYEVRVLRNCQIGIYATNGLVFTRPVDPGPNTCTDDQADWLRLSFTADNHLTVHFNDADPFEVALADPSGLYTGGGLELVVSRARATFSYVVVTKPATDGV